MQMDIRLIRHSPYAEPIRIPADAARTLDAGDLQYGGLLGDDERLELRPHPDGSVTVTRRQDGSVGAAEHAGPDSGSAHRVRINGHSFIVGDSARMQPGDLITIGGYGWVLHQYATGHGAALEPVDPLPGASIEMDDVHVDDRLHVERLIIPAGQFVGVIGPSGSGKSTLIREIAADRAGSGSVRIGGQARSGDFDPATDRVAYVPQADLVHDDLTLVQQTIDYVRLARNDIDRRDIESAMCRVGLREAMHRFPSTVSGGQLRRGRIAAAVARRPSVMVLDEPDSGLDPETADSVRRLLRTFSRLGATVIAITHHRHDLASSTGPFDRVIELDGGTIVRDTSPQSDIPNRIRGEIDDDASSIAGPSWWSRIGLLIRRQTSLLIQGRMGSRRDSPSPLRRAIDVLTRDVCIVLFWMPMLFAVAVSLALPSFDFGSADDWRYTPLRPYLTAFLWVLSVVWLSSSHAHLSLTASYDRERFEQLQGGRPADYLIAKSVFLSFGSVVQSAVFVAFAWLVRRGLMGSPILDIRGDDTPLIDGNLFSVVGMVTLAGLSATQVGLLISAIAMGRGRVAAAILPVVMMAQILFSPFIVRPDRSDALIEEAFEGLWAGKVSWGLPRRRCGGLAGCPSHLVRYYAEHGYQCKLCRDALGDVQFADDEAERKELLTLDPDELAMRIEDNQNAPNALAMMASYATLTRHADAAIRVSLSRDATREPSDPDDPMNQDALRYGYQSVWRWSVAWLIALGILCHGFSHVIYDWHGFHHRLARWFNRGTVSRLWPIACAMAFCATSTRADDPASIDAVQIDATQTDAPQINTPQTIRIPIRDGRYDAAKVRLLSKSPGNAIEPGATIKPDSANESGDPVWIPMTGRTRVGLTMLKLAGAIEDYQIDDDAMVVRVKADRVGRLTQALFPPVWEDGDTESSEVMVLVHGLEGGVTTFRRSIAAIEADGWRTARLIYPNDGDIQIPIDALVDRFKAFREDGDVDRVVVVGHSMGGLVAYGALAELRSAGESDQLISDLVLIGTPLGGSKLAQFQADLEAADVATQLLTIHRDRLDMVRDGRGEAIDVLRIDSPSRRQLLSRPLPDGLRLHVHRGRGGPIAARNRDRFVAGLQRRIDDPDTDPNFRDELRVLISADELIAGLGDGAVTLESAADVPSHAIDNVVVNEVHDASHTGMLDAERHPEIWQRILMPLESSPPAVADDR